MSELAFRSRSARSHCCPYSLHIHCALWCLSATVADAGFSAWFCCTGSDRMMPSASADVASSLVEWMSAALEDEELERE